MKKQYFLQKVKRMKKINDYKKYWDNFNIPLYALVKQVKKNKNNNEQKTTKI